jgi:hypothetical protein
MGAYRPQGIRGALGFLVALLVLVLLGPAAHPARAATEVLYVPQTGHYVRGVFRDFWDRNGGLANFGYPITEEYVEPGTNKVIQYFERARFERATATASTVQLGLIGREVLGNRTFVRSQPTANTQQRRYFPETGHIVQYGFKEVWETRGGLAIFGLPLSDEILEQLADGKTYTVQYFERARFEFHPNLPAGQRVMLSDLGRALAPRNLTAPVPANSPPGTPAAAPTATPTPAQPGSTPPSLVRPVVPAGRNARVVPAAGVAGEVFVLDARGFQPGEEVSVWVTAPDQSVLGANFRVTADELGSITSNGIYFPTDEDTPLGIWAMTAEGITSGNQAIGYFQVISSPIGRAPPPAAGVPANVNARVEPPAGRAGTIFFFDASNFRAGEEVTIDVFASDGSKVTSAFTVAADSAGRIGYAGIYYVTSFDSPLGLYRFVATGKASGNVSTGYFVLTP